MPQSFKTHLNYIEQNLLSDIKEAYGLCGTFEQSDSFAVWEDRIVIAFSVDGQRYFLKQWPCYIESEEESAFVLAIQAYARDRGVPVPGIFRTVDGEYILNWNGRRFSLQVFVGTPYAPGERSRHIMSCARTLGIFHQAVAGAQIGGKGWRDDPFAYSMNFIQEARKRVPEHSLSSDNKKRVDALCNELLDLLDEAKYRLLDLGWLDLPQMPIHGDYCQFNCRFEGGQVVGIVDWDSARLGSRLLDVAHALNIGLGWRGSIDYYEDFLWRDAVVPNRQVFTDWLIEYSRTAPPLSDKELQLLPLVCSALWPAPSSGFEPKCDAEVPGCDALVQYMRHYLVGAEDISKDLKASL